MSFISYAQNYEDVMLWRALKDIENGFYIDVGAAWPDDHSVTKSFYDRGWRGINIEPNPVHHASLVMQRPRDINLQLAIGECAGQLTMNLVGDTGLSTLDTDIADQHKDGGWGVVQQTVSVDTLASVCAQHLPTGQEVHFLKVDVEGFEEQALRSYNWKEFRPWIVLVEATLPMTQQESYESWEPILLGADYLFVYADGLNRFYVAKEHANLALVLKYPPNVFDGFMLIDQKKAEAKAKHAEAKAQQAEAKAQQASDQAQQFQVQVQKIAAQLESIYTSRSWRLTAPLRQLMNLMRSFKQS
jgi:FkbM family methyltransferase